MKIRKNSRGLGLCIYGGRDSSRIDPFHQLIRISNLHPSQPALECGKLTLGDVILAVNGTSMLGMTNSVSNIYAFDLFSNKSQTLYIFVK